MEIASQRWRKYAPLVKKLDSRSYSSLSLRSLLLAVHIISNVTGGPFFPALQSLSLHAEAVEDWETAASSTLLLGPNLLSFDISLYKDTGCLQALLDALPTLCPMPKRLTIELY